MPSAAACPPSDTTAVPTRTRAAPLVLASSSMPPSRLSLILAIGLASVLTAAPPRPEDTWPGFRGHALSGIAFGGFVLERWSVRENVRWKIDVPGRGWSSPIVWGDTVFLTSAISSKPFKQPSPGLYGNDYIAELRAQGVPGEEINRRVRARDIESSAEADRIRYMVYAVDAASGKIYKVRVGGGGHTFSASPVAAGGRILLLTEEGLTFVIAAGDEYREIGRNDLAEMSLASPAIAGAALYIRTESKLYKIQHQS